MAIVKKDGTRVNRTDLGEISTYLGKKMREANLKESVAQMHDDHGRLMMMAMRAIYGRARGHGEANKRELKRLIALVENNVKTVANQLAILKARKADESYDWPYPTVPLDASAIVSPTASQIPVVHRGVYILPSTGKARLALIGEDAVGLCVSVSGDGASNGTVLYAQDGQELETTVPTGSVPGTWLYLDNSGALTLWSTLVATYPPGTVVKPIARHLSGSGRVKVYDKDLIPLP